MKRTKCVDCSSERLTIGADARGVTICKSCGTVQSDRIGWTHSGAASLLAAVMDQPDPASIAAADRASHLVSFVTAMTESPYEISMALIAAIILHVCGETRSQAQVREHFTAIIRSLESARDTEVPQA